MRITKASVIVCSPGRNFVTLKIETDEGIYGLGDATLNGRELAVASYLSEHVIPCLIGRDPFQIDSPATPLWCPTCLTVSPTRACRQISSARCADAAVSRPTACGCYALGFTHVLQAR